MKRKAAGFGEKELSRVGGCGGREKKQKGYGEFLREKPVRARF